MPSTPIRPARTRTVVGTYTRPGMSADRGEHGTGRQPRHGAVADIPARYRGSAGPGGRPRGVAPRRCHGRQRRLRRRRRVLRDLGLPDHLAHDRRIASEPAGIDPRLLRAPGPTDPPGRVRGDRGDGPRREMATRADRRPHHCDRRAMGRRVRRELSLNPPGHRLFRDQLTAVAAAAFLVARRRGAVLPRVADGVARARDPRAPSRPSAARPATRTRGHRRRFAVLVDSPDDDQRDDCVLLTVHARVGARYRRARRVVLVHDRTDALPRAGGGHLDRARVRRDHCVRIQREDRLSRVRSLAPGRGDRGSSSQGESDSPHGQPDGSSACGRCGSSAGSRTPCISGIGRC